jgi:Kdo2-lipid IVA lauroyltransferase/acyltransferase
MTRAGIAEASRTADAMYRSLGTGVFELLALALSPKKTIAVAGLSPALTEVLGRDCRRGVVVATAHTGNWDLVACGLAARVPLTVITKRLSVSWLNSCWQRLRAARGVRLVEAGAAARVARRALGQGEWVAALIDQAPERRRGVTSAAFLGARADVDLAPALLALRARCPLVVAFPRRTPDGHEVELAGILEPPPGAGRQWAEQAMLEATAWLEAFVRRHPDQWLWMHRRWKRAPRDAHPSPKSARNVSLAQSG